MTIKEINQVLTQSEKAFKTYRSYSGKQKAAFLRQIAVEIESLSDVLIQTASRESNLPIARLTGERGRTTGQLRLFADYVEEGSWVDATIDTAIPDRQPLPKVDLRKMLVPMGTVVVFGASNFPLAFSTAGGDTASALASGCPVVVKGHPAHIETSRLVASAIEKAAAVTKMPKGVFGHVEGGIEVGKHLAKHPSVSAVAFTGSYMAGKALFDIANKRKQPIPVFAEMGSINPVILFENALKERNESLSTQLADSVTLGVGQFCTNPGLILGVESAAFESFLLGFTSKIQAKTAAPMLHEGIAKNYQKGLEMFTNQAETAVSTIENTNNPISGHPSVGVVSGASFLKNKVLHQEVFGPFSLVVKCKDKSELKRIVKKLEGQLTATLMSEPSDLTSNKDIIAAISEKCGRLIVNNVPTGVEVTHAMQHGGPFPSTTDSRFTSVGTSAILRFVRPFCYQNYPNDLLPDALKESNSLSIWRKINGVLNK
ncbi:MAG: aldehyde dehydrogenase (NADP(+)) [Saprospiraceae bacterium]|nr:aldehyde dehydrogenase (NADP(+)) [Saprospiraceae bacterium]